MSKRRAPKKRGPELSGPLSVRRSPQARSKRATPKAKRDSASRGRRKVEDERPRDSRGRFTSKASASKERGTSRTTRGASPGSRKEGGKSNTAQRKSATVSRSARAQDTKSTLAVTRTSKSKGEQERHAARTGSKSDKKKPRIAQPLGSASREASRKASTPPSSIAAKSRPKGPAKRQPKSTTASIAKQKSAKSIRRVSTAPKKRRGRVPIPPKVDKPAKRTKPARSAVISTVRIAGTPRDKARDPKSGRFVSLAPGADVVRSVRVGGKRVTLTRKSRAKVRKASRKDVGKAFEAEARPREAANTLRNQGELGKAQYLKLGGRVYRIQRSKEGDLQSFITDIGSKFFQLARKSKVGSPDLWLGVTIGDNGAMLDLDRIDMMDPELAQEFAGSKDFARSQRELARYLTDRASYYLGVEADAEGVFDEMQARLDEAAEEAEDDEGNEED